jgi:hypothetical protein
MGWPVFCTIVRILLCTSISVIFPHSWSSIFPISLIYGTFYLYSDCSSLESGAT